MKNVFMVLILVLILVSYNNPCACVEKNYIV